MYILQKKKQNYYPQSHIVSGTTTYLKNVYIKMLRKKNLNEYLWEMGVSDEDLLIFTLLISIFEFLVQAYSTSVI